MSLKENCLLLKLLIGVWNERQTYKFKILIGLVASGMVEPGNKSDDEKPVLHRPKKEIRFDEDTI